MSLCRLRPARRAGRSLWFGAVHPALGLGAVGLALLLGVTAAFAQETPTNWPQHRFEPGHTGFNPNETVLNPGNVSNLVQLWKLTLGPGGTGLGGGLVASPSYVDGVLYQHSQDGNLYAINADTGEVMWSAPTVGYGSSQPAVVNGVVYVGTIDGVRAYPTSCTTPCQPTWVAEPGMTFNYAVTYSDGVVYATAYDGRIVAIDAASGTETWSAQVNVGEPIFGAAAVADGLVFVPGGRGIYAFPLNCKGRRCQPKWTRKTDFSLEKSPVVANGIVYAASTQGTLYAWDDQKGTQRFSTFTNFGPQTPAIADGVLYLTTGDTTLWAFAADCKGQRCGPLWRTKVNQSPYEPVVANGVVYLGSLNQIYLNGTLFAYPAACSDFCLPLWSVAVRGAIESGPTVVNGRVYVGTLLGDLYAFALPAR